MCIQSVTVIKKKFIFDQTVGMMTQKKSQDVCYILVKLKEKKETDLKSVQKKYGYKFWKPDKTQLATLFRPYMSQRKLRWSKQLQNPKGMV